MEGFRFSTDPDEPQGYSQPKYTIIVNDLPKFELASYISNYKGRTILTRLYLIASCCPPLREEATKLLVAEAKKGSDTTIYQDAVSLLNKFNPPADGSTGLDMAWLEKREKQNAAETARLESELKGYKNNLIKESIRVSPCFRRRQATSDLVSRWAMRISVHTTTKLVILHPLLKRLLGCETTAQLQPTLLLQHSILYWSASNREIGLPFSLKSTRFETSK